MALTIEIKADSTQVNQVTAQVSANLSAVFAGIQNQLKAMESVSGQTSAKMAAGLEQSTQRMIASVTKLEQATTQGFHAIHTSMNRVIAGLAAFGVSVSFANLITGAVQTAATFEQLDTQLKFVVGSMEEFQRARQFILQFTATTPLQLGEVTKAFIDLTRRGFEVQRTMKAVADVASLQLFPSEAFQHIIFQLGQIADRSKLTGDNLKDLSTSGVSIGRVTEELRAMGVVIKGDIGDASVSAAQGIEAIVRVLEKDFRDATLATAGNWLTLVSNLKDTWGVFQDFVVRGPLLDFLKGLVSVIGNELTRAVHEDQAAFEAWGASAVTWIQTVILNVAGLVDGLSIIADPIISASKALFNFAKQFDVFTNDLLSRALGGVAGALETLFAPEATVKAMRQAAEAVKGKGTGDIFLQSVLPTEGAAKSRVTSILDTIGQETSRLQGKQADILQQRQAENARKQPKLSDTIAQDTGKAVKAAEQQAKERARVEQQALEKSLQEQVALVAQSFDARRQIIDQKFAEDLAREPLRVKELSAVRSAELQATTVEEARFIEQVQLDSLSRQTLTAEEFAAKHEVIAKRRGEVELRASQQVLQQQIKDAEELVSLTDRVNQQILDRDEKMQDERTRVLERELEQQQRAYERFSDQVIGFLDNAFQGLLSGTLNAVDFFKQILIRQLSNIAANVLGPLITGLSSSLIGGVASILPSTLGQAVLTSAGLGGTGGTGTGTTGTGGIGTLQGLGLLASLKTISGGFTNALEGLTGTLVNAGSTISQAVGGPALLTAGQVGQASTVGGGTAGAYVLPGGVLSAAGGLAALGGGIYGALTAANTASRAAFAASAAAGAAVAGVSAAGAGAFGTTAAAGVAGLTGWTGVGLIAAAALAVAGTLLNKFISPAGPSLSVRAGGGLGIGVQDGRLAVQGDLGSRVTRREGVDRGMAQGVQAQLESGITAAVVSIVGTINAVALDPAALVGPTQEALQRALRNLQPINSANAKKMEQDITEQLRFANLAIVGGILEPLNLAFNQLRNNADLKQQLERLPATTAGLVDIFRNMNTQIDEINKSANTDVLRQLSSVRTQVENFGRRIADTAGAIAENIVTGILESFEAEADTTLAGQITQFAGLLNDAFGALAGLRTTQQSLEGAGLPGGGVGSQIDRLTKSMTETAARISTGIVSTALGGLSADLQRVLVQPLEVQAITVNGLFNDALASLGAIGAQWQKFSTEGLATGAIEQQFNRLVGGMLDSVDRLMTSAFATGPFDEFLRVAASIPDAVTALNPAWQQLQRMAAAFAQVAEPVAQNIMELEDAARSTGERAVFAAQRVADLRRAIVDAGTAADQALPLYAKLADAIQANADLQIHGIQALQQAWESAMDEIQGAIDTLEEGFGSLDQQLSRTMTDLTRAATDFDTALSAGNMVEAVHAVQAYGQGLVRVAELQIEQIEAQREATIDAQQAYIAGIQDQIDIQQAYINGIQDEVDVQQLYIDGIQDQVDAVNDAIQAQQAHVDALVDEARAREEAVHTLVQEMDALEQLRDRIGEIIRPELAPTRHAAAIREELTATQSRLQTATGDDATAALERLVGLNEELIALGKSSSQLSLIQEGMDNLVGLQTSLNDRLGVKQTELSVALDQLGAANAAYVVANAQLVVLHDQLGALTEQHILAQAQLDILNAQLAFEQRQMGALESQLEVQQRVLTAVEESTYWDEQIAMVQTRLLEDLNLLKDWLMTVQGDVTWENQILAVQEATLAQLRGIQDELRQLFAAQPLAQSLLHLGDQTNAQTSLMQQQLNAEYHSMLYLQSVNNQMGNLASMVRQNEAIIQALNRPLRTVAALQGGVIHLATGGTATSMASLNLAMTGPLQVHQYASGGMVPVMAEPGERVFVGATAAQQGALMAMNQAFPRFASGGFTVPGKGSGDTMPLMLPSGSFILNRHAAGAMGFQGGGIVHGGNTSVTVNVDLRGSQVRNEGDYRRLKSEFREAVKEALKEIERRSPKRGQ